MMYFDGRNPYGSKGGYVRDHAMDSRSDYNYGPMMDYEMDERRRRMDGKVYYSDGHYPYHHEMMYYPHDMDYRSHKRASYLSEEELRKWSSRLMREIGERENLKMEAIMKRAESLAINFDKFSPHEFYTTMLMIYSDFHKTLGTANVDLYLKLAKDWLCDEDAEVRYGEKLAAYYYSVVKGE